MAWQIPLSTSTVGAAVPLPGADSLFVSEGVTLASSTGYAVQTGGGSNQEIVVHGTVVGWAGILATNVTGATITVGETGRVSGLNANAMFIVGTDTEIHNAGTIETLSTISKGIMLSGTVAGSTATLENSGTIRAIDTAIQTNTKLGTLQVDNSGLIWAKGDAFFDGVGSIDTIVNTGTIQGDVKLGGGQDLFDSRKGLVDGEVYGGSGNDRLYTGLGSQQIYGETGYDVLMGGAGSDELNGGADVDTASYASATAGVTASLAVPAANTGDAKGDGYISIERLYGSKFADKLIGDDAANRLTGGGGADSLTGGGGADQFVFVTKPMGSASADRITDFKTDLDEIRLDDDVFMGLVQGNLSGDAFWASNAGTAHDGSDRVIYEKDTGWLRFDADGNGAGAAVAFAKLGTNLNLGADDFFVI